MTLLPHMLFAAAHDFPAAYVHDFTVAHVFAAALVYRTFFLLPHMYTTHVLLKIFKKIRLDQGFTWFEQSSSFLSTSFFELSQFEQLNISHNYFIIIFNLHSFTVETNLNLLAKLTTGGWTGFHLPRSRVSVSSRVSFSSRFFFRVEISSGSSLVFSSWKPSRSDVV